MKLVVHMDAHGRYDHPLPQEFNIHWPPNLGLPQVTTDLSSKQAAKAGPAARIILTPFS